jgi:hypothetical protein
MATLDELIQARLEEKRQEKLEAERQEQEAIAERERQSRLVANLFTKRLENQYGPDKLASPYQIEARFINGGEFEARIHLNHPSEYPTVVYAYSLILHEAEGRLETVKSDDPPWDGWRDDDNWLSCNNLIDAIIYALSLETA